MTSRPGVEQFDIKGAGSLCSFKRVFDVIDQPGRCPRKHHGLVHNPDRPAGVILQGKERSVVAVFPHAKINSFTERLCALIVSRRNRGSVLG
jgi:hypothetical protein